MAIGYDRAKNLMKQLDWKMLISMKGGIIQAAEIYHPNQPHRYTVRRDSAKKLLPECRACGQKDCSTTILCYDHDGSNEELI